MAKTTDTKHELEKVNKEHELVKEDVYDIQNNKIFGQDISFLIGNRIMQRTDPIYYCENTLRCHLPEKKRHLHENQVELIKAVCNPHYRKVAGLMARQAGKTESIASFTGYLLDNYPQMRIGIFTPRIQQAEVGKILPLYS